MFWKVYAYRYYICGRHDEGPDVDLTLKEVIMYSLQALIDLEHLAE